MRAFAIAGSSVLTEVGKYLISYRQIVLGKKVKDAYSGYAFAQIKNYCPHQKRNRSPKILAFKMKRR
jgi:hypothetical protein